MNLKEFIHANIKRNTIYINPEYVTSVIEADENNETLIYLTGDEVIRVVGTLHEVVRDLQG